MLFSHERYKLRKMNFLVLAQTYQSSFQELDLALQLLILLLQDHALSVSKGELERFIVAASHLLNDLSIRAVLESRRELLVL